ncbi:hypothetical protein [Mycolicibacterium thermoresistibile]|uniref:Polyketide cyclase / dehydrase and lipid transport n=2 Tax=Mycolicibacterium thermoresistibile TaxID=1797 RepID=G7CE82_MYCT3|nr:hypothetical protein [Mycolicibacterium thermoresistibile]EHI13731.1 hypothetical protein KEK_06468 [Mycolicibacterium thermoresistibile ATCC 19527]MCV7189365.1 SRPBCC family protein [Mycolicibacterium thermoresistibile]GAT14452.1 putative uncharacterized protein [Mycolicibacterium thermoresistibile]SNW19685.1 Uncharacterised protein [Mycolicibacterium thermoresistibile]
MRRPLAVFAGTAALLYAARRYYRNWGTTKHECRQRLPGDELIRPPLVRTTEGVWIDRPAETVWPWLVQMGHNRGGLYGRGGLQALLGLARDSADRIHPQWQHLEPGDRVQLAPPGWLGRPAGLVMTVAQVLDGEALVLRGSPPDMPWDSVISFHVLARGPDKCRLLVRSRTALRRPGQVLVAELAGPVAALLTRGLLLGIKHRAEAPSSAEEALVSAEKI